MAKQSPKTIATINFKGGVGKTTVTWCLGDLVSELSDARVLLFDLDAQMSLTQSITLNDDQHSLEPGFEEWYERSIARKKTIFDALDKFTTPGTHFDFPVGFDFIYKLTNDLHFVPSVEELYWMELGFFDRDKAKDFVRRLLGKISNSPKLPDYDYVLFDCPPSFTTLSYSVLACSDLILIPVNPDFFAAKGVNLLLNSLRMRIEPYPLPKIAVFMNKTRTYADDPTRESANYMREVRLVCQKARASGNIDAQFLKSWIPLRVGVKRAVTSGGVPPGLVDPFRRLWEEVTEYVG